MGRGGTRRWLVLLGDKMPGGFAGVRWSPVLVLLAAAHAACAGADDELLIKAGFVTKFPSYITWPASSERAAPGDFLYCVAAASPLLPQLEALVPLAAADSARPSLRILQEPRDAGHCNLLVLPPIPLSQLRRLVAEFADRPVLLIGDAPGFGRAGVHINLYRDGDRVRFEINRAAFRRSGLRVGFRLLEMARLVE